MLRCLETTAAPPTGNFTLTVNGRDVNNWNVEQVTLPVRVFNRDFVAESVFPLEGGEVAPIFVVGKENVENQKKVEKLKNRVVKSQKKLNSARTKKEEAVRVLDRFCIDRAKVIKDTLRSSGSNPYNNYDKANFRERAANMEAAGDAAKHRLDDGAREALLAQQRASPKPKTDPLNYSLPNLSSFSDTVNDILAMTVVSAAIHSLKVDAALSAWVHQGLGLHKEQEAKSCLFCDQPLPPERLAALEAHFSSEYEDLLRRIDGQIAALGSAASEATELSLPGVGEFYDDLADEYQTAAAALRAERDSTIQTVQALQRALESKRNSVFESVALSVSIPDLNNEVIKQFNDVVAKHNKACNEFQSRIDEARKSIEADSVARNLDELVKLRAAVNAEDNAANVAASEVTKTSEEIGELERQIIEHRQPAEELNSDLHHYLGHNELRMEVKETGYQIMRHGAIAESLSEGEMTAIALLYFLKSLQDRRFELSKGVVVLDDPVSSLDANALYSAFGFIRERTNNASQLFVLTHNFTFFRQVRNWFHHLKGQNKKDINQRPARFFMLECTYNQDRRCARIKWLDPLLERFESEYHYLFAQIHRAANASPAPKLEDNYVLPNLARRLLEAFLAFRRPQLSGELWHKLQSLTFDEAKKIRILRFLNTHSHSSAFGEPEHDLSLLSEAPAVLNDLLSLMRAEDKEHFAAMETLVSSEDGE